MLSQGGQAQAPGRGSTAGGDRSSGGSGDRKPYPAVIMEDPEAESPGSPGDSTLVLNCRRTGSLGPGEKIRYQYWAKEKQVVNLLLSSNRGGLAADLTPRAGRTPVKAGQKNLLSDRIEFWQAGRHQLIVRNRGETTLDFTLVWISLDPEELQSVAYESIYEGRIETPGDVDAYALDVRTVAQLEFRFALTADGVFTHGVALLSRDDGLAQYSTGKGSSRFTWQPEKPEELILALYSDRGDTRYRARVVQQAQKVLLPGSDGSTAVELSPGAETSVALPLAVQARWRLQVEEEGDPFSLRGELRVPGKPTQEFRLSPQTTTASLQLSHGGDIELMLENTDTNIGRVRVLVTELAWSFDWLSLLALLAGCFGAGGLFSFTCHPRSGPFHHLRFPKRHVRYCFAVSLVSAIVLAALLWFGEPVLSDLQKLIGLPFQHLARASGFVGLIVTLFWINSLVKSRQKTEKQPS